MLMVHSGCQSVQALKDNIPVHVDPSSVRHRDTVYMFNEHSVPVRTVVEHISVNDHTGEWRVLPEPETTVCRLVGADDNGVVYTWEVSAREQIFVIPAQGARGDYVRAGTIRSAFAFYNAELQRYLYYRA